MGRSRLLALRAALERERASVRRSLLQVTDAADRVRSNPADELVVYGLAALLDTTYTGMEKALTRALAAFEGVPAGAHWHREVLAAAALDVPGVRPAVLTQASFKALEPFLGFRHRFRNLYLFDLQAGPVLDLAGALPSAVSCFDADLSRFEESVVEEL